jgi:hypothetical protein
MAGCPIRVRMARRSLAAPHPRFAALRALLRLLAPRHPPHALLRLAVPPNASPSHDEDAQVFAMRLCASNPLVAQRALLTRARNSSFASKLARYGKIEAVVTMRSTLVRCASCTLITICGCSRNVSPYSQRALSGDGLASERARRDGTTYHSHRTPMSEALVYHAICRT